MSKLHDIESKTHIHTFLLTAWVDSASIHNDALIAHRSQLVGPKPVPKLRLGGLGIRDTCVEPYFDKRTPGNSGNKRFR